MGDELVDGGGTVDHVAAHHAKARGRPVDTIWRQNPRDQGLIGVGDAIAWFSARGWHVAVPLIDNQPYDLVVDDGRGLQRVQVKTTTTTSRHGVYIVALCTSGGNQSYSTRSPFDASACDLLYVLTDARERYLIPTSVISARNSLNLGARLRSYRLPTI